MLQDRLIKIIVALAIVLAIGTAAFMAIEKWTLLESLYMTVITITTVGFQEVRPLSGNGRIFTIFLILLGTGVLLYALSSIVAFIVEGKLLDIFRRKKMKSKIEDMNEQIIVCGSDGCAEYIIDELIKTKDPFVVIENDSDKIKELQKREDILFLEGDASEDEILKEAGILRAKGLISALPSDKDNLFVVLTARGINKNLRIISLAIDQNSEHKLRRAGADSVVTPNAIGGMRMASTMLRPIVVSFLDKMLYSKEATIRVEEASIAKGSDLTGKSLAQAKIGEKTGLIIIAVRDGKTGSFHYNPGSTTIIKENDILITIGTPEQMKALRGMAR